jgi:hypothetical protein
VDAVTADPVRLPFPRTAPEITAEWLTEVLRADGAIDDATWVDSHSLRELSVGFGQTSDTTRVLLELGGSPPPGAPKSLVGKFATTDATRRAASISAHLYENEITFYRDVAAHITTAAPHCFYAGSDGDGEYFALLLQDFAGHRPGDETVGATRDEALQAVAQLAGLHGPYWGRAQESGSRPWRMLPLDRVVGAWPVMVETFGDCLPPAVRDMKDAFLNSIPALHEWMVGEPSTLAHGDFRLDNLLFDDSPGRTDPIIVLDWQAVHTGRGIRDFAYLVAHSMATPERRACEQDLLRSYVEQLAAFGVDYPFATAWQDYRIANLYLLSIVLWITGVNVNTNERALRRKRALVQRASTALLDLDALALLPFA